MQGLHPGPASASPFTKHWHQQPGWQVDEHRYSVWVPGNCASVRLAKLLASDTVVMKLVSPEIEWYYPLLQPGRHYLPVWVKGNDTGLPEAVAWARSHPTAVRPPHANCDRPLDMCMRH